MKSNRIGSKLIKDSKTQYHGELGKGVIWALKEFNNLTIAEISKLLSWKKQSIKDEIRRLKNSILFYFLVEEKNDKGYNIYDLDPLMKRASLELITKLTKLTYLFNEPPKRKYKK